MLTLVERGVVRSEIALSSLPYLGKQPETPGQPSALSSPIVQVLRVGKFNHPVYGEFEITKQVLAEMIQNFKERVRGVDLAFDYFHDADKEAAGWVTDLYLSEEGAELWARVDWTPRAQQKLTEREIRYFSPDFAFEWQDPESGKVFKNVLFGGGLTNRPFVKDMAAIVAQEEREHMLKLEELAEKVVKLEESFAAAVKKLDEMVAAAVPPKAAVVEAVKEEGGDEAESMDSLKKKLADMTAKCAELEDKMKAYLAEKQMAEKTTAFNVLLAEGKACAAQKDAFLKGDLVAFTKLAQPLNLEGRGSNKDEDLSVSLDERILKRAKELSKANPKLSELEAISLAQREVK